MKAQNTIRIIKSAERNGDRSSKNAAKAEDTPPSNSVTSQVTSWVKEFQQRRRPDPRRAFASLFADPTGPLGSLS